MRIYFAPLEGITGYLYRNIHHDFYTGIDKYYTPFLSPGPTTGLGVKMLKDILPENNQGVPLVPQLMTNRAEDFIKSAEIIREHGYREINLNLGCPSKTVVAKKKGSGFLYYTDELERFLDAIFESRPVTSGETEISIKTRIGKDSPEEWPELMNIYNRYPMKELIIHPRIQKDFYRNQPKMDVFRGALAESKNPVVYNGDLFTARDVFGFMEKFPSVHTVMLGRGLITDPGLAEKIQKLPGVLENEEETWHEKRKENDGADGVPGEGGPLKQNLRPDVLLEQIFRTEILPEEIPRLREFLERLCEDYSEAFSGDKNVLFKMKELWCYMIARFPDSGKYGKRIKKAQSLTEYRAAADALFSDTEKGRNL